MDSPQRCLECGTLWTDGVTCQDHFYQMGYWELENPTALYEVHHLMVLSYHLQHPSLYSPTGLSNAKELLVDFLTTGITPSAMRQKIRGDVDSGVRKFKIKSTAESFGTYEYPVQWTMTAASVTTGGVDTYCDNVKAWAQSILESLKASGNLDA